MPGASVPSVKVFLRGLCIFFRFLVIELDAGGKESLAVVEKRMYVPPGKQLYKGVEILVFGSPPQHPWTARVSVKGAKTTTENVSLKQGIAWVL